MAVLKMNSFLHILMMAVICFTGVNSIPCDSEVHPIYGQTGKCVVTSSCPGNKFISNLCPNDPANVKCCFTVLDSQCGTHDHSEYGLTGKCMSTSKCPDDEYKSSLCPSYGNDVKCCFTGSDVECIDYEHTDYGFNGKCVPTSKCPDTASGANGYVSNKCPSFANDIRCCFAADPSVPRSAWEASAPTETTALSTSPVPHVFIHHTTGARCTTEAGCQTRVKQVQTYHMGTNGWSDIGYSFLVGEDGNVYEGRGWDLSGAHTLDYNDISLAFSFIGDFSTSLPNSAALDAVQHAIEYGVLQGKIASDYTLSGHRDVKNTLCPGTALYNEITTWSHYDDLS